MTVRTRCSGTNRSCWTRWHPRAAASGCRGPRGAISQGSIGSIQDKLYDDGIIERPSPDATRNRSTRLVWSASAPPWSSPVFVGRLHRVRAGRHRPDGGSSGQPDVRRPGDAGPGAEGCSAARGAGRCARPECGYPTDGSSRGLRERCCRTPSSWVGPIAGSTPWWRPTTTRPRTRPDSRLVSRSRGLAPARPAPNSLRNFVTTVSRLLFSRYSHAGHP